MQANLLALDAERELNGEVLNVGTGTKSSLLDLVAAINQILGTHLEPELREPRAGDVRHSLASLDQIRAVLGYEPTVDFQGGSPTDFERRQVMTASESPDQLAALMTRIESKSALVGIIGLGYVGLPLARNFTSKGFAVLGFDTDPAKVERLSRGKSYIGHIDDDTIAAMITQGFEATSDFERLREPDAILICVPTPLTEAKEPDLRYIVRSAEAIGSQLRPGQLVILESTTYPGTTRDVMQPILARGGWERRTRLLPRVQPRA